MTDDPLRRPPATPASATGFEFNRPTIIGLLYLASFVTGITAVVGLVLAYVWRNEPHEPWEATHYTYLIRQFWIALIVGFVGFMLVIVLIGFPILFAIGIWMLVRTVLSLVNAQNRKAMPQPETLLV